jgi:citrate lyase subunit beta/citryl-CoA lyase
MLVDDLTLRSFMFLPAHNKRYIDKAIASEADAIILDVEDSVPPLKKVEAREAIITYCKEGLFNHRKNVFIRLKPIETDDFIEYIDELTLDSIDGFMPSKVNVAKDMEYIDSLLSFYERKKGYAVGKFKLTPLIETTKALDNISEIAKSSNRIVALCLGGEDYLNDLGSVFTYQETALAFPRAIVVNTARANGILPIDTPYLDIGDIDGFKKHSIIAYKNGFAGCLIVNPRQIEVANSAFTPDDEKVEMSRRVIDAIKKANVEGTSGVAMLDGSMIGPPMRKRAENVLRQIGEE